MASSQSKHSISANVASLVVVVALGMVSFLPASPVLAGGATGGAPLWIYDSDLYVRHVATADLTGDGRPEVIGAEYDTTYYGEPSKVIAVDGATGLSLWSYDLLDGVRSMTIADVNGDGTPDAVAGASYNGSATPDGRVHAIDGTDGSVIWTFPTGATTAGVASGDLNGDASADIIAASFDDSIYAIDGATGTQLWNTVLGSLWVNAVATGDVTGDGFDDVGFAHEYLTGFDNYLGVLDGTDGSVVWQLTVPYVVLDVLIDDVDGDGQLEAVFGGATDSDRALVYVRNAATGALEWEYDMGSMDHVNGVIELYFEDVDGDLDRDLVVANSTTGRQVFAFEGNVASPLWVSENLEGFPKELGFGDVTGDGNMNVLAATDDRVQVLEGADGTKAWYYAVGGTIASVAAADVDGDGACDVLAGGSAETSGTPPNPAKSIWALRTAESPVAWELDFGQYGNAVTLRDLDGDGAEEVIVVTSLDDAVHVIDGATGQIRWSWTGTENLYAVTTGQFDSAGDIDVAVAGNDDTVTVLLGETGGIWWQFPVGDQVYRGCLAAAELTGDSADDVVVGSDDDTIYVIDGSAGTVHWSQNYGGDVEEVELAFMNGDGFLDIVAAIGWPGNRVVVVDGPTGSLAWQYQQGTNYARHVEVLDANGDGTLDVGVGIPKIGAQPGRVFVIDGVTRLELWSVPFLPNTDYGFAHADLDFDGNEDLVAAGNSDDRSVHALDGASGAELWVFQTGGDVNVVRTADLDGDGRNEVIGGSDDQIVHVLDGASGEEFFSFSTAGDVIDVGVGDVTGDGKPNLAAVTFDSDGVAYVFRPLAERVTYFDDTAAQFFIVSGTWPTRSYFECYGGSLAFRRAGTGVNQAAWRLDTFQGNPFLAPGTYDVYHWKFDHPRLSQMATNAKFKVFDKNGGTNVLLDLSLPNNTWQHLGTFEFDNDTPQGVLVSDAANGFVVADAIRLIRR